jgi:hypothetical protein
MTGVTTSTCKRLLTMPPITGVARGFMTSAPVRVLHMIGRRLAITVATVMTFGLRRSMAPSMRRKTDKEHPPRWGLQAHCKETRRAKFCRIFRIVARLKAMACTIPPAEARSLPRRAGPGSGLLPPQVMRACPRGQTCRPPHHAHLHRVLPSKFSTFAGIFSPAARSTAPASGCSLYCSRAAASDRISLSLPGLIATTLVTLGRPSVSVPVLSTTSAVTYREPRALRRP